MDSITNNFGRNNQGALKIICGLMNDDNKKYMGMSWAEINFAIEEEEEEENRKKVKEIFQKRDDKCKYLYNIGKYELEEGEILE